MDPLTMVVDMAKAGFTAPQMVQPLVSTFGAQLTLENFVPTIVRGMKNADVAPPDPLTQQQVVRAAFIAQQAAGIPPASIVPPPPQVQSGIAPSRITPLVDPQPSTIGLHPIPAGRGAPPTLLVNTGKYLHFINRTTGAAKAVAQAGVWGAHPKVMPGMACAWDGITKLLHAFKADGSELWTQQVPDGRYVVGSLTVVHQSYADGVMRGFDMSDGTLQWTVAVAPAVTQGLEGMAAADGLVYMKTVPGNGRAGVAAIDEGSGATVWEWQSDQPAQWTYSPDLVVAEGTVFCGLTPFVTFLNAMTGQVQTTFSNWNQQAPAAFSWAVSPAGAHRVVIGVRSIVAYLADYLVSSTPPSFWPSLQQTQDPPDPNTNGPTRAITYGPGALTVYRTGPTTNVDYLKLAAGEDSIPGVRQQSISGVLYNPSVVGNVLYALAQTSPRKSIVNYLVATTLPPPSSLA